MTTPTLDERQLARNFTLDTVFEDSTAQSEDQPETSDTRQPAHAPAREYQPPLEPIPEGT